MDYFFVLRREVGVKRLGYFQLTGTSFSSRINTLDFLKFIKGVIRWNKNWRRKNNWFSFCFSFWWLNSRGSWNSMFNFGNVFLEFLKINFRTVFWMIILRIANVLFGLSVG